MGIPNDKKVKEALKTLKDYCLSRGCDNCGIYSICPYIRTLTVPPCDWNVDEIMSSDVGTGTKHIECDPKRGWRWVTDTKAELDVGTGKE